MGDRELIRATPAARLLAERMKVDLKDVVGTGYKSRIHKDDVAGWNFQTKVHVSPLARKMAEVHGIDLKDVKGSGHNNKVMKEDVLKLINGGTSAPKVAVQEEKVEVKEVQTTSNEREERIPMTNMRKIIGKRMSESFFGIPTFVETWEIDMTEILALRAKLIEPIKEKTGHKLTVTDLISMAVIKTLMKHKYINCSLSEDESEIIFHNYVNLAIAVGLEEGLLVPVVKNAHEMSLSELVVATKDVIGRTLKKKLTPDEQMGSTFTISNLGMYPVDNFSAIINQPNAAILSVSGTKKTAVVIDDELVIRPIMKVGLTSDHRLIDGLTAAKFMLDLKNELENPLGLLI